MRTSTKLTSYPQGVHLGSHQRACHSPDTTALLSPGTLCMQIMMDVAFKQQQELVEAGEAERAEQMDMLARGGCPDDVRDSSL